MNERYAIYVEITVDKEKFQGIMDALIYVKRKLDSLILNEEIAHYHIIGKREVIELD